MHLAGASLLIIYELGYVAFTDVGSRLLFEVISRRDENGVNLATSNQPLDGQTRVFDPERLTRALLNRRTHHVDILKMNGELPTGDVKKRASRVNAIAAPDLSHST